MRRASAGRTSARLSGNNQVDIMRFRSIPGKGLTQTKSDLGRKPAKSLAEVFQLTAYCTVLWRHSQIHGRERRPSRLGAGGHAPPLAAPEAEEVRIGTEHKQVVLVGE